MSGSAGFDGVAPAACLCRVAAHPPFGRICRADAFSFLRSESAAVVSQTRRALHHGWTACPAPLWWRPP